MPDERPIGGAEGGYTDREMRLIFERAGQLDVQAGSDRRFSLAELREMGAQAGLDPADVTKAAVAIRSARPTGGMLGTPTRFSAVSHVARRLDEAAVADVVLRIREATNFHGELRTVPGGMEWRVRSPMGLIIIDFSFRGQGTRIDLLVAQEDQAAAIVVGTSVGGFLLGLGTTFSAVGGLHAPVIAAIGLGAATAIGLGWGGARLIWSRVGRGVARKTSSLMGTILEAVEAGPIDRGPPAQP
ncbi:MAG: hypothetical protein ABJF01_06430 [bacterium]